MKCLTCRNSNSLYRFHFPRSFKSCVRCYFSILVPFKIALTVSWRFRQKETILVKWFSTRFWLDNYTHRHARVRAYICVYVWCLYLGSSYSFISILNKTRGIVYLLSNECKYCHNIIDHFSGCHQDQGKTVGIDFNTL